MKTYLLFFLPIFVLSVDHSVIVDDGKGYARGLLSNAKSNFDSNVIQPITTGSEMKSLNGTESFTAQMTCSDTVGSAKFITVNYGGSDNISIYVNVDFDLDGNSDSSWNYSNVSGVCGNGVVKCNGGWDQAHCKYYQWNFNTGANTLGLSEVTGDLVNSCYCTNSACTNEALSKKEEILNTLLTSVSQTIANNKPEYILTRTENTGSLATGFAQSTTGCTQAHMGSQVGVSSEQLTNNANAEIGYQSSQGEDTSYGFMTQQQDNIVNNPIKAEATTFAQNQVSFDTSVANNLDLDQDNMRVNSYGDGTFTDNAQLADLGIEQEQLTYCKVKVWEEASIVYSDSTNTNEEKADTKKYHIAIRECENNTCLYDNSKEELLENCAADTNNFQEAVSQLAAINEASKDMVCSSN